MSSWHYCIIAIFTIHLQWLWKVLCTILNIYLIMFPKKLMFRRSATYSTKCVFFNSNLKRIRQNFLKLIAQRHKTSFLLYTWELLCWHFYIIAICTIQIQWLWKVLCTILNIYHIMFPKKLMFRRSATYNTKCVFWEVRSTWPHFY